MAQQRFDKDRKKSFGGYGKPKGDYKRPYGGSPRNERSDYDRDERPADFADSDDVTGLIVGRNPVMEALKSGKALDTIYVNENAGGSIGAITRIARERGIVIKNVSDQKLTQMCGGASHQGIIASGACAEYVSVEDILAISKRKALRLSSSYAMR